MVKAIATRDPNERLRYGFLCALFAGFVIITVINFSTGGGGLAAALAVSVMAVYCLWGAWLTKMRINVDQFADSLYYLGFLFTLVALAVSMVPFLGGGDTGLSAEMALERFGLALVTTIVGMCGRVYFSQFRYSGEEEKAEAKGQIGRGGQQLANEISAALGYIKSARDDDMLARKQGIDEALGALRRATEQSTKSMEVAASTANQAIQQGTDKSVKAISEITGHSVSAVRDITKEVTSRTRQVITTFEKRVNAFEPPENLLAERVGPLFESLKVKLADLEKTVADVTRINGINASAMQAIHPAAKEAHDGLKALGGEAKRVQGLTEQVATVKGEVAALNTSLQSLKGTLTACEEAFRAHTGKIAEWTSGTDEQQKKIRGVGDRLKEELEAVTGEIRKVVTELTTAVERINEAIKQRITRDP